MWRIRQALASFMYGRYGIDKLYNAMLVLWLVLSVLNIFIGSVIIWFAEIALFGFMFFRAFSKNIYKRRAENERFKRVLNRFSDSFKLLWTRVRDIGSKRYRRCPYCRAVLRLPVNKGKHTVKCPRCSKGFNVKIIV